MACKYTININGVEHSFDTINTLDNNDFNSFGNFLETLSEEDIKSLVSELENSKKPTIVLSDSLGNSIPNIVGTTSINSLVENTNLNSLNTSETDKVFAKAISNLYTLLQSNNLDLSKNNIITSNFENNEDKNFAAKYYADQKFLLIDINDVKNGKYVNILKGLVDYSIDNVIGELELLDYFSNLPTTYVSSPDIDENISLLEDKLQVDRGTLKLMYSLHNPIIKSSEIVVNNNVKIKNSTFDTFAKTIYKKYKNLIFEDLYYSPELKSEEFPSIKAGDLLKVKTTSRPAGEFKTYVGVYTTPSINTLGEEYNKATFVVVNRDGTIEHLQGDDILFNNNFSYKKNVSTDAIDINKVNKTFNNPPENFMVLNTNNRAESIVSNLKNGDFITIKKGKGQIKYNVLKVLSNFTIVNTDADTLPVLIPNNSDIFSVGLLKENHSDIDIILNTNNPADNLFTIANGFVNTPIKSNTTSERRGEILKALSKGDLVKYGDKIGYVVSFTEDVIKVLNNNVTEIVNKSDVSSVIYNLKNQDLIGIKRNKEDILNLFNQYKEGNHLSYGSNRQNTLSIYDVSTPTSNLSINLKKGIISGDYVINKRGDIFYVMSESKGILKVFNLAQSVQSIDDYEVTHVIKKNAILTEYSDQTVKMNSPLIGTNSAINVTDGFKKESMIYVIPKGSPKEFITASEFKGGKWISKNSMNPEIYDDVTKDYSTAVYGKDFPMFGLVTTNQSENHIVFNTTGKNKVTNFSGLSFNEFINDLQVGSFLKLKDDKKTYRVEEVAPEGITLTYSMRDIDGNIIDSMKFIKSDYLQNVENSVDILYTDNVIGFSNNLNGDSNLPKTPIVEAKDNLEVLGVIVDYLKETFNVPIGIRNQSDFDAFQEKTGIDFSQTKAMIWEGTIMINVDKASIMDPLHEVMHLVMGTLKVTNPELFSVLVNRIVSHPDFKMESDKYSDLTQFDRYEEAFIAIFTNAVKNNLPSLKTHSAFDTTEFKTTINKVVAGMMKVEADMRNVSAQEILSKSPFKIINNFGSTLFNSPETYYNKNIAISSIEVTSLKRKLLKENSLIERDCN